MRLSNRQKSKDKVVVYQITSKIKDSILLCFIFGLVIGIISGFLLHNDILINLLPKEGTRLAFPFFTAIFGIIGVLSWNSISSMVEKAIDEEAQRKKENEKQEEQKSSYEYADNELKEEYSAVVSRYGDEGVYQSGIFIFDSQDKGNKSSPWANHLAREFTLRGLDYLNMVEEGSRKAILRLDLEKDPLIELALSGAIRALGMIDSSPEEIERDANINLLSRDMYLYLKTWLMISIRNHRMMNCYEIKRRYPYRGSDDVSKHIEALIVIKDVSIRKEEYMKEYIEPLFLGQAVNILDFYLNYLIRQLKALQLKAF